MTSRSCRRDLPYVKVRTNGARGGWLRQRKSKELCKNVARRSTRFVRIFVFEFRRCFRAFGVVAREGVARSRRITRSTNLRRDASLTWRAVRRQTPAPRQAPSRQPTTCWVDGAGGPLTSIVAFRSHGASERTAREAERPGRSRDVSPAASSSASRAPRRRMNGRRLESGAGGMRLLPERTLQHKYHNKRTQ